VIIRDHERSGAKRSELVLACERKRASKLNNNKQASNTASNQQQAKGNNRKQATDSKQATTVKAIATNDSKQEQ
jgi:hypothetical protein